MSSHHHTQSLSWRSISLAVLGMWMLAMTLCLWHCTVGFGANSMTSGGAHSCCHKTTGTTGGNQAATGDCKAFQTPATVQVEQLIPGAPVFQHFQAETFVFALISQASLTAQQLSVQQLRDFSPPAPAVSMQWESQLGFLAPPVA